MASSSEEVAAQASAVATASEEMAATSADIARNCSNAAEGSRLANDAAYRGDQLITGTVERMLLVNDRVKESA